MMLFRFVIGRKVVPCIYVHRSFRFVSRLMVGGGSFPTAYGRVSCYKTFVIISAAIVLENLRPLLKNLLFGQVSFVPPPSPFPRITSLRFSTLPYPIFPPPPFCLSLLTLHFSFQFFFFFVTFFVCFSNATQRRRLRRDVADNYKIFRYFLFFFHQLIYINYVNQNRRNGEISVLLLFAL